jgi:acetyl esterase
MTLEGLHPQAQALLDGFEAEGGPPLYELSVEEARAIPAALRELIGPGPEVATVRDVSFSGPAGPLAARVYEPVSDPPATVVYYHGGGWVLVTIDDVDAACRALAVASGCRVVNVEYRLAPEHPFPAAADDAYAALVWVAADIAGGKPIVVAGDSAGGNLSAVTALRARVESGPAIALQVLVYPVVDHDYTTGSYEEYGDAGLLLGKQEMIWFWDHYAPREADWSSPHASPLRAADHSGLPPAYVLIAEFDPLRDEGLAYAEKLEAAGVPVTVRRFDDQLHAFFHMVNLMESADVAVGEVGQAIRAAAGNPS